MATTPTPAEKFFAVLNKQLEDTGKDTIDPADYTAPEPRPYTGAIFQRNTFLVLDPPLESLITGRITCLYDRIPFEEFTNMRIEKGSATTLLELLPQINEALGMELSLADLQPATVPSSGPMTVRASDNNLIYTGILTVELVV